MISSRYRVALAGALGAILGMACSSSDRGGSGVDSGIGSGSDAATMICAPGQSIACVGIGGCQGGQACKDDGSGYEACACGSGSDGGALDASQSTDGAGATDSGLDSSRSTDGSGAMDGAPAPDGSGKCGSLDESCCNGTACDSGYHCSSGICVSSACTSGCNIASDCAQQGYICCSLSGAASCGAGCTGVCADSATCTSDGYYVCP